MVEAWSYEPAKQKKKKTQKRKKNGGCGTVKEKEPWCPSVTFPFPYPL